MLPCCPRTTPPVCDATTVASSASVAAVRLANADVSTECMVWRRASELDWRWFKRRCCASGRRSTVSPPPPPRPLPTPPPLAPAPSSPRWTRMWASLNSSRDVVGDTEPRLSTGAAACQLSCAVLLVSGSCASLLTKPGAGETLCCSLPFLPTPESGRRAAGLAAGSRSCMLVQGLRRGGAATSGAAAAAAAAADDDTAAR